MNDESFCVAKAVFSFFFSFVLHLIIIFAAKYHVS